MQVHRIQEREPIAIVGLSCRFPDAPSPEAYWDLLREARSALRLVPKERWDNDVYYDAEPKAPGKIGCRQAAFINDPFDFEPRFFGISDREAERMDPQQRLALELAWEAFERSGLTMDQLRGSRTGVYVGTMTNDYGKITVSPEFEGVDAYHLTGNWGSFLPGHIAYFFGLCGPVVAIDAACASSLAAVHLASQALRAGECDLAIAGGISLMLSPELSIVLTKAGALSPDGQSRAFDASANGMGRGEGGAVLVLKRLADALADMDPIVAVVGGSAMNHGGQSAGFTVPNGQAQVRVIRDALRAAGCGPDDISYIEAHGTGTRLGDPIEGRALTEVFGRDAHNALPIGSVKTNLGHLDSAAGMAGLIKVILGLEHEMLPAQLHFAVGNPEIDWAKSGLRVVTAAEAWPRKPGFPRMAGVSAYGMSGINAHVVVREAPPRDLPEAVEHRSLILPLTAHSELALKRRASQWAERILASSAQECSRLVATAAHRSTHLERRLVARADSQLGLVEQLNRYANGGSSPELLVGQSRGDEGVCFVFSGQGSAWNGMATELWSGSACFRTAVLECIRYFGDDLQAKLLAVLSSDGGGLDDTRIAQPAIFCVQVGLLRVWAELGVEPNVVVGHSLGEVTAAYAAGALDLESACRIIELRSRVMQVAKGGKMAQIALSRAEAENQVGRLADVEIAAFNGPESTVVTGGSVAVERVVAALLAAGVEARVLDLDYAFHSASLEQIEQEFIRGLAGLRCLPPSKTMISTVSGEPVENLDAAYWFANLRRPVEFVAAIACCADLGCQRFVEVGPHPVLTKDLSRALKASAADSMATVVHSLSRRQNDIAGLELNALRLFVSGQRLNWKALGIDQGRSALVPAYPWARKPYRVTAPQPVARRSARAHALLGEEGVAPGGVAIRFWQRLLTVGSFHYLRDHRLGEAVVFPGAGFVAMFAAAASNGSGVPVVLRDIKFVQPLVLRDEPQMLQVMVRDGAFLANSRDADGDWHNHCTAQLESPGTTVDAHAGFRHLDRLAAQLRLARVTATPDEEYGAVEHRLKLEAAGMSYGPLFSGVRRVIRRGPEAIVEITADHLSVGAEGEHGIHPTLLDCCFQAAAVFLPKGTSTNFLPAAIRAIRWPARPIPRRLTCHARLTEASPRRLVARLTLLDEQNEPVMEVDGFELLEVGQRRARLRGMNAYEVEWREVVETRERVLPSGCLIFDDQLGFAEAFAERLRHLGIRVVMVERGAAFGQLRADRFAVNPCRQQCMTALLSAMPEAVSWPEVHFWNLCEPPTSRAASIESFLAAACGSLPTLLQARQLARIRGAVPLVVVTRGAHAVEEADATSAIQAAAWGFMRTARVEMPSLAGCCVDAGLTESPAEVADRLLDEVFAKSFTFEVVLRGPRRLVPVLVAARSSETETRVAVDGAHVIVGGNGGVGLAMARALVAKGARCLALFGRRPPGEAALVVIRELEAQGARVRPYAVDATDEEALAAAMSKVTIELAPIVGVIHAAGVVQDTSILRMDWANLWQVLAPKVLSAYNLHVFAEREELHYLSLFSSISSVLGNPGQANYAAANAVLDALAEHRSLSGKVATAINWGAWAETGMLQGKVETANRLSERGVDALSVDEACEGFFAVPNGRRQTVARFDAERWAQSYDSPWLRRFLHELAASAGKDRKDLRTVLATLSRADARLRVAGELGSLLAAVLRTEPSSLDQDTSFDRLGIDSILSVEFAASVDAAFDIELGGSALWSFSRLRSLSEHVVTLLGLSDVANATPEAPRLTTDESTALSELVGLIS